MSGLFMSPHWQLMLANKLLADGWGQNLRKKTRLCDVWWICQHLEKIDCIDALEFGGWDTDAWRLVAEHVKNLTVTDSFGWASRECASQMYPREQWEKEIKEAGHKTYQLDICDLVDVEQYDCIYSISVIEHVQEDVDAMKRIHRALKPGGIFVFTTEVNIYVGLPYQEDVFFGVYSLDGIKTKLKEAGFEIDECVIPEEANFDMCMKEAVENPWLLRKPYKHFAPMGFCARRT